MNFSTLIWFLGKENEKVEKAWNRRRERERIFLPAGRVPSANWIEREGWIRDLLARKGGWSACVCERETERRWGRERRENFGNVVASK